METSKAGDVAQLAPRLRDGDLQELRYYNGATAYGELLASFQNAKLCFTLKDSSENPVAMFGVGWTPSPRVGRIWLLSSDFIYAIEQLFLRQCPYFVSIFMRGHDVLYNHIYDRNIVSIRWLEWLGFEAGARFPETGPEKQPFTEYTLFKDKKTKRMYLEKTWDPEFYTDHF